MVATVAMLRSPLTTTKAKMMMRKACWPRIMQFIMSSCATRNCTLLWERFLQARQDY